MINLLPIDPLLSAREVCRSLDYRSDRPRHHPYSVVPREAYQFKLRPNNKELRLTREQIVRGVVSDLYSGL